VLASLAREDEMTNSSIFCIHFRVSIVEEVCVIHHSLGGVLIAALPLSDAGIPADCLRDVAPAAGV